MWKSGDLAEEAGYDALRRRVCSWQWNTAGTPTKVLRERFVYGEALATTSPAYDPAEDQLAAASTACTTAPGGSSTRTT